MDPNINHRTRKRALIRKYKEVPCYDCYNSFPSFVMEFDHTRGKRKFSVAQGTSRGYADLLDEIQKCDVVCANCHRIRTHERKQQTGFKLEGK